MSKQESLQSPSEGHKSDVSIETTTPGVLADMTATVINGGSPRAVDPTVEFFGQSLAAETLSPQIAADLYQELHPPQPLTPMQHFLKNRERTKPGDIVAELKVKTGFTEVAHNVHIPHRFMEGFMTLRRRLAGGHIETYQDKLEKERKKGQQEAIAVGTAHVGKHEIVLTAMHWDFYAGSVGSVVGEMIRRAAELAIKRRDSILDVISSAGVRQPENYLGLVQMRKINYALEKFARRTGLLHVVAFNGEAWGGIDASSGQKGDLTTAFPGTNKGFTGGRLIEGFTGQPVPAGAQSAEMHTLHRNIDLIVPSVDGLLKLTDGILSVVERQKKRHKVEKIDDSLIRPIKRLSQAERFRFDNEGFSNFYFDEPLKFAEEEIYSAKERKDTAGESLEERLSAIEGNPNRPDTEFLLRTCFDDAIPLYNRFVLENKAEYPAIIAGIGYIGDQPFLVIGNQPSYKRFGNNVAKITASPKPADFDYMVRMLKLGEKLGIPAVFFTDTPGASPTLEAEFAGQSRAISQALDATDWYKYPTVSIITGELGSGGGLATSPIADKQAAGSRAMLFVAHPKSATEIIYNTSTASQEQIRETINSIGATAQQQKAMGLIDDVIDEPFGGAEADPHEMAERIRVYIAKTMSEYAQVSPKTLRKMRDQKMANMHGGALSA